MNKSPFCFALCGVLLTGCANKAPHHEEPQPIQPDPLQLTRVVQEDIYQSSEYQKYPEVVRYDRYTLISTSPMGGQKYLLDQLVSVNMVGKGTNKYLLSVRQGLEKTLNNTGYTLCRLSSPEITHLFNLPLPKVHYKFGPMKLRDALQMLAGEAHELTVNDSKREVCFERRLALPIPAETNVYIKNEVKNN
ncbi:hypothetical protein ACLS0F_10795 [Avibacterium endocarditidis]|uniref:PFGI-1 class ICE element type IV pilus protein PilL2 n=1 Tax=Avibacterium endocarditidis TaxID=380674 RepID=UPI0039F0FEA6